MTQPRITPSQVEVAEARRTTLPNGIGLYTLASDDFEVLRISFVFRAGSALQQAPFSASAAANLLSEGSRDMTAHQIAEQLDYYGSWYDVNIDRDYLSKFFDPTLAVAEQILLCPAFPEEELRTYAAKRRQRLAVERAKIDFGKGTPERVLKLVGGRTYTGDATAEFRRSDKPFVFLFGV